VTEISTQCVNNNNDDNNSLYFVSAALRLGSAWVLARVSAGGCVIARAKRRVCVAIGCCDHMVITPLSGEKKVRDLDTVYHSSLLISSLLPNVDLYFS